MTFNDRHVVVTGGTGGLGKAVVRRLVAAGAHCHLPHPDADTTIAGLEGDAITLYPRLDLTDEAAVTEFYAGLPVLWASIHLAGGFAMAPIEETSLDDFLGQMRINTQTCFLTCREAVKAMKRSGQGGRIVNVAARPGLEPRSGAGMPAYTASKAAVAALTEALGEALAGDGILVNAVAPSIIDTPANRSAMPDADHDAWPKPEQIAETITWLASPDNTVTRSALVPVYGPV